ncbi:IclR family transcriptional regulator [Actinomadura madurae]|uniref:IclR family transcriptional regulator n=1 Tax=Actinomadura madurae TaxID=1993 RepID=UPI0020D235C3|nr:IclR family transcriptional regulator [Actinomadura madurae]MCP9972586.1 IclR family transcriptional regulator [Actinomadura madurae]
MGRGGAHRVRLPAQHAAVRARAARPRPRGLREAALPFLEDLYEATHENIHLAVLDGTDTLFLEKVTGRRSMPIVSRVGGRLPAYCTATGKLFLALGPPLRLERVLAAGLVRYTPHTIIMPGLLQRELARTADRGYAVNREESEAGVSAVAAPVLDHRRHVIAAISITGNVCGWTSTGSPRPCGPRRWRCRGSCPGRAPAE